MAVRTYTINLEDKISPNAANAAKQVRLLTGAMSKLEDAATKAAALGDVKGFASARQQYSMLGAEVARLEQAFPKAGLQAHSFGSEIGFASAAASAVAMAAVAAAAAVVAFGGAVYAFSRQVIEASENLELLRSRFAALQGGSESAGDAALSSVRGVARELGASEATVEKWAVSLQAAGVTDLSQLRAELYAIRGAEALIGDEAAGLKDKLQRLHEQALAGTKIKFSIAQLQGTGLSEREFLDALGMTPANFAAAKKAATLTGDQVATAITNAINKKAAGPLDKLRYSMGAAANYGKDVFKHLFEGADLSGIGEQIRAFFALFDPGATASGDALKHGIGGAFKALDIPGIMKKMRYFFEDVIIWSLKTYNFLRHNFFGPFDAWMKKHDGWNVLLKGLEGLGVALAVVVGLMAATAAGAVGMFAVVAGLNAAVVLFAGHLLVDLADALGWLVNAVPRAYQAASDWVLGIVKGIENGIGSVVESVKHLGKSAWEALTGFWHAHSPSQLAFGLGANIGEGQALGIESKEGRVQSAAISTSSVAAGSMAGAGAGGGNVSQSNHFEIVIHAQPGQSAREIVDQLEERLPSIMERLALTQGAAPVPS